MTEAGAATPLMPHYRSTCARLCHVAGRELEQIQFLLGHVSVQTTERYLGGLQTEDQRCRERSHWHRTNDLDGRRLIRTDPKGGRVGVSEMRLGRVNMHPLPGLALAFAQS